MPQRVLCHKCGVVLYEGTEVREPHEVVSDYDGKCPNCRIKLSFIPRKVEIGPAGETDIIGQLRTRKRR